MITNKDRANYGRETVEFYGSNKEGRHDYEDTATVMGDLIADLMHFADEEGIDFTEVIGTAEINHTAEVEEDD